jgi:hypothetical protein
MRMSDEESLARAAVGGAHRCGGGCGKVVSANKDRCQECIQLAQAAVEAKSGQPAEASTHILTRYDSKDQEDLYRADGMLVASRQNDIVRFGHDIATAQSRLFLNVPLAKAWLRKLAQVDLAASAAGKPLHELVYNYAALTGDVSIEERNAESLLTLPGRLKGVN